MDATCRDIGVPVYLRRSSTEKSTGKWRFLRHLETASLECGSIGCYRVSHAMGVGYAV